MLRRLQVRFSSQEPMIDSNTASTLAAASASGGGGGAALAYE